MSRRDEDDDRDDEDDDEDEGELVERGTFSVDMAVAAEKLAEYQLPDAGDFLLPWLRAAVASGAKRVSAGVVDGALTFQFDGDAPDPAVLGDLTAGLLTGAGDAAAKHLAYGALALQRLKPDAVHAAREDDLTVLRVRWARSSPAAGALRRLRAAYGMTDVVLTIDGEPVPDPARAKEPVKAWRGTRTRVVILEDGFAGQGRVRLFVLGALVETLSMNLGGSFTAYAANNRFALSLSQSGVIRDARFEKFERRLTRMRRRLAQHEPSGAARLRSFATAAALTAGGAVVTGTALYLAVRLLSSF